MELHSRSCSAPTRISTWPTRTRWRPSSLPARTQRTAGGTMLPSSTATETAQVRQDNIRNRARNGIAPASQDKSQKLAMQNRTSRYSGNSLQYCFLKKPVISGALTQDSNQGQLLKA